VHETRVVPTSAQSGSCRPTCYADLAVKVLVVGGDRAARVGMILAVEPSLLLRSIEKEEIWRDGTEGGREL